MAVTINGLVQSTSTFTGQPVAGSYSTPDNKGHVERNDESGQWEAWREDSPGVTAHYDHFEHAAQYAHHGYSDGDA